jgi:hypothetical protein
MKALITSLLLLLATAAMVVGGDELREAIVPNAARTVGEATLRDAADAARVQAVLHGDDDFTPYLAGSFIDGTLEVGDGTLTFTFGEDVCLVLFGGPVDEPTRIEGC